MQSACRAAGGTAWSSRRPSSSTTTSSPGATSRSSSAPTRSSAHVSDATTWSSPTRPSTSGRKPCGSRNASSFSSARTTTEKAPSSRAIAFATACSTGAGSLATRAAITSVSDVVERRVPASASSSRSSAALTRFPLCPSATVRALPWWTSGWAFAQWVEPVVE